MPGNDRPKVAFFSFTCCEGCQLTVLSCENELPEILREIKIVNFREAVSERGEDYSIAFVEGSVSTPKEIRKLKHIRQRASLLVSFGACSAIGGVNCLKNRYPMEALQRRVYGRGADKNPAFATIPARPIDAVVKVDHYVHGCPISKKEFISLLTALLMGKRPPVVSHPVCADCKMAGNVCVFEKGKTCLGPVTRAGCEAVCVTYGAVCWGCRGRLEDSNVAAHVETLKRHGLDDDGVKRAFDLYWAADRNTARK